MRIALIDPTPERRRERLYPIGLLRLGAYLRERGDQVELFTNRVPSEGIFDEAWLSVVFTYHIPHALGIVKKLDGRVSRVRVGGPAASLLPDYFTKTGAEVHVGRLPEAESFAPAYDLLGFDPEYSIARMTRGCPRKCEWCAVPIIEGKFTQHEWVGDLDVRAKRILFYDDNILALPARKLGPELANLRALCDAGTVQTFDFNQGLDPRLVGEKDGKQQPGAVEKCDAFAKLPLDPVRFAFDGMHEDGWVQSAIRRFAQRGHANFMSLVLYNYEDAPRDMYHRLRALQQTSSDVTDELGRWVRCQSVPMRYSPIDRVGRDRDYVGQNWSVDLLHSFRALANGHAVTGQISTDTMEEFEYWFGQDADEFVRMLRYPRIKELAEKRKLFIRGLRAKLRDEGRGNRMDLARELVAVREARANA